MPKLSNIGASRDMKEVYKSSSLFLKYEIDEDASSGLTLEVPYDCEIFDVQVICTATNTSGTVTVSDGTNDISDAIVCDTLDEIGRASTIDATYASLPKEGTITLTTAGAADRGIVRIFANLA